MSSTVWSASCSSTEPTQWQRIFFFLLGMKHHPTSNTTLTCQIYAAFHFVILLHLFTVWCVLTNLFFKPQDNFSELYKLRALARGFAERSFAFHSEANRQPEVYHDLQVCISTTYPSLKGMRLRMRVCTAVNSYMCS